MTDDTDDDDFNMSTSLVEQVAEAMAIFSGSTDCEQFLPLAAEYLQRFRAVVQREPHNYLEIETFSIERLKASRVKVVAGNEA